MSTTYKEERGLLKVPVLHLLQLWAFVNDNVKWTVTEQGCYTITDEEIERNKELLGICLNDSKYPVISIHYPVTLHQLFFVATNKST